MAWTTPRTWVAGETPSASTFNTHVRDNLSWLYSGDAWTNVTVFSNSWAAYDTTSWQVRYGHVGPFTVLQGLVKSGTVGSACFTLPVGYRPGKNMIWSTSDSAGGTHYAELRVNSDGTVVPNVSSNTTWFSLHPAIFLTEG